LKVRRSSARTRSAGEEATAGAGGTTAEDVSGRQRRSRPSARHRFRVQPELHREVIVVPHEPLLYNHIVFDETVCYDADACGSSCSSAVFARAEVGHVRADEVRAHGVTLFVDVPNDVFREERAVWEG